MRSFCGLFGARKSEANENCSDVLCTLKTEQRGDKEGPEPAVLANL